MLHDSEVPTGASAVASPGLLRLTAVTASRPTAWLFLSTMDVSRKKVISSGRVTVLGREIDMSGGWGVGVGVGRGGNKAGKAQ